MNAEMKSTFPGTYSGASASEPKDEGHSAVLARANKLLTQLRSGTSGSSVNTSVSKY